jgi:hypothetical protein
MNFFQKLVMVVWFLYMALIFVLNGGNPHFESWQPIEIAVIVGIPSMMAGGLIWVCNLNRS